MVSPIELFNFLLLLSSTEEKIVDHRCGSLQCLGDSLTGLQWWIFIEMFRDQCSNKGQSVWVEAFIIVIRRNKSFAPERWIFSHAGWMSVLGMVCLNWQECNLNGAKVAEHYQPLIIRLLHVKRGDHVTVNSGSRPTWAKASRRPSGFKHLGGKRCGINK